MHQNPRQVVVDIFNWIQVTSQRPDIVMRGIYRHAHQLAKEFQPVYYLTPEENENVLPAFDVAHQKLEALLGKRIIRFTEVQHIEEYAKIWLSIGMDNVSPVLPDLRGKVLRATVLHDIMAYRKVFGPQCEKNFMFGAQHHDLLLPVSNHALSEYRDLSNNGVPSNQHSVFYGCFHTVDKLSPPTSSVSYSSYSVGTIEPRKRVNAMAHTSHALGFGIHHHIGAKEESENETSLARLLESGRLRWHKALSDADQSVIAKNCAAFFCLSSDEGFSMTPMEAMLAGTPYVFLSDIPAHREIYGGYSVNFLRIGEMPLDKPLTDFKQVRKEDRLDLLESYAWQNVIAPFKSYMASIQ